MEMFKGKSPAPGGGRFEKGKEELKEKGHGAGLAGGIMPPAGQALGAVDPAAKARQVQSMLSQTLGAAPDHMPMGGQEAPPPGDVAHHHPEMNLTHSHPTGDIPHRHG